MSIQSIVGTSAYHGLGSISSIQPNSVSKMPAGISEKVIGPTGIDQDSVTISDAAKRLAASSQELEKHLAEIKAKPATQRSLADTDYLYKNDQKLAAVTAKDQSKRTAEEINYMQEAGGFVNTFATLSPNEMKLYDELVSQGNTDAANGIALVAMSRMMGSNDVTLSNGKTFNPSKTEITPQNIRQLFSQMFSGTDDQNSKSFDALASFLDKQNSTAAKA